MCPPYVSLYFLLIRSAKLNLASWRTVWRHPLLVSFLGVWTLLWLSGKNSGEAARLWCPLLPILLAVAAGGLANPVESSDAASSVEESNSERRWLILLSCQAAVCVPTVIRVSGFHF